MGKTVATAVGLVAAVAIAVYAPAIGAAIFGSLVSAAVATAIVTVALGVALSVGMTMLMKGSPTSQVGPPQVFRQSIADSFIVYGKRRVGGLLVFFHGRKDGKRHYRYFVIACAGHRCKGLVQFMLNDEAVSVDSNGKVTSGPYANAAWLWFKRGHAAETAHATFVAECGGRWTANHKGTGIAKIYAKFEMTDAVVQAGMPNITAIIEGRDEIDDPRGATDYTRNAALIFYDWMKMPREEGGFGAYEDEMPDASFIAAQANVCDETVNGQPRYAIDGVIVTGAAPNEIRDVLIVNQAGSYTYSGGKHIMRPGYWVPPSATLAEDDLAGPIQVSPFMASDAAANEVQGTYIEPADGYQGKPFATQSVVTTDIRQLDLDLAFTTSPHQAERVARIMLNRAQHEKTVMWPMNIAGLKVKALDTVQLDSDRYGLSNYAWSVVDWSLSADYGVIVNLKEESADIYDAPSVTAPAVVPQIESGEPILTDREASTLIANSFTDPSRILSASESGSAASIEIITHNRIYPGGRSVSVTGATITGLLTDTPYFIYYDDPTLAGGAVTLHATTDGGLANLGIDRHSLGRIRTPIAASGITYQGGGVYPTGSAVGGELPRQTEL